MAGLNGTGQNIGALSWLNQFRQEIQVLDYELHASLRILATGEIDSEQMTAFMEAAARRKRLMARVISHCAQALRSKADQRKLNLLGNRQTVAARSMPGASHTEAPLPDLAASADRNAYQSTHLNSLPQIRK